MTYSKTNKSLNKQFNAACSTCGGWTSSGGMSQFYSTHMGCDCYKSPARKMINKVCKWLAIKIG